MKIFFLLFLLLQIGSSCLSLKNCHVSCAVFSRLMTVVSSAGIAFTKDGRYMAVAERRDCKDFISIFVCSDWQLLRVRHVLTFPACFANLPLGLPTRFLSITWLLPWLQVRFYSSSSLVQYFKQVWFFSFGCSILTLKRKICLGSNGLPTAAFWRRGIRVWRYEDKADYFPGEFKLVCSHHV